MIVTWPVPLGKGDEHVTEHIFSYRAFCRFLGGKDDMSYTVAGIDIHKEVLMVVVAIAGEEVAEPAGEAIEFAPTSVDVPSIPPGRVSSAVARRARRRK
jgi:hypothetical protein